MQDTRFIAELHSAGLFPGNSKAKFKNLPTSACAANCFIDDVIMPDIEYNRTNLNKLLAVMAKFDNDTVKDLAADIQRAL